MVEPNRSALAASLIHPRDMPAGVCPKSISVLAVNRIHQRAQLMGVLELCGKGALGWAQE